MFKKLTPKNDTTDKIVPLSTLLPYNFYHLKNAKVVSFSRLKFHKYWISIT
jgi:hypothetical protein